MAQFAVAVTGGVASGKSAVCDHLAALGASVIDADLISRELVEPGQPALAEIVAAFGADMLDEHGALRRRLMRERIFGDAPARARLEAILHPRVRLLLRERALAASGRYAVLAIPLLIETGHYSWLDRIVAIDVPEAIQLDRLMQRDGVDIGLARAMLQAQASRQQRLAIASDVVINDADLGTLERICDRLHHWLLDRAMQAARGD
jgi:dephospho-CoA kinase